MAPPFNNAPTSAERRGTPILDKYLCRVCNFFKPNVHYSKKELSSYTNNHLRGNRVNGVTAKLRCRGCAGGGINEIFCEGPCEEYKSLDKFSKNSRSAGGNKWCQSCTLWKESQEDGLISAAPPEAELAPDEDGGFFPGERMSSYYDPEAGDGEGDDDDDYGYSGSSAAWGVSHPVPVAPRSTISGSARSYGTPDAGLGKLTVSGGGHGENVSSISGSASGWVAPHLRNSSASSSGEVRSNNPSEASSSSVSNPYATNSKNEALTGAQWTAVDARRRGAPATVANPIAYNAWDSSGRQHLKTRYPSSSEQAMSDSSSVVSSTSTKPAGSAASAATVRGPAWPNTTQTRPANGTTSTSGQQRSNSNWAKPVGTRSQGPQYQPSRPSTAPKRAADDSDEEEYM